MKSEHRLWAVFWVCMAVALVADMALARWESIERVRMECGE